MTATPNAHLGLDRPCPRCSAPANQRCHSASGRELRVTHNGRARAALDAEPVRMWLADARAWRTG